MTGPYFSIGCRVYEVDESNLVSVEQSPGSASSVAEAMNKGRKVRLGTPTPPSTDPEKNAVIEAARYLSNNMPSCDSGPFSLLQELRNALQALDAKEADQ